MSVGLGFILILSIQQAFLRPIYRTLFWEPFMRLGLARTEKRIWEFVIEASENEGLQNKEMKRRETETERERMSSQLCGLA